MFYQSNQDVYDHDSVQNVTKTFRLSSSFHNPGLCMNSHSSSVPLSSLSEISMSSGSSDASWNNYGLQHRQNLNALQIQGTKGRMPRVHKHQQLVHQHDTGHANQ